MAKKPGQGITACVRASYASCKNRPCERRPQNHNSSHCNDKRRNERLTDAYSLVCFSLGTTPPPPPPPPSAAAHTCSAYKQKAHRTRIPFPSQYLPRVHQKGLSTAAAVAGRQRTQRVAH
eukprot:GHVU01122208.1.p1 GENE.GHVU01122208.1~~GHVU01122208.1.p1  ORF type:complete len:120 (+),score=9.72 GHVU01122208.1:502-861(+)